MKQYKLFILFLIAVYFLKLTNSQIEEEEDTGRVTEEEGSVDVPQEEEDSPTCQETEIYLNGLCRCIPPYIRVDGACVYSQSWASCPASTYLNWATYACEPCHPSCGTCWGPENNQCLTCVETPEGPPLLNAITGVCEVQDTCRVGAHMGAAFCAYDSCLMTEQAFMNPFDSSCPSECSIDNDIVGAFFNYNLCGPQLCDARCGPYNYNGGYRQCLQPHNPGVCYACSDGSVPVLVTTILQGESYSNIYQCLSQAPSNTMLISVPEEESESFEYVYCSSECATCEGSPDNCVTCAAPDRLPDEQGKCTIVAPAPISDSAYARFAATVTSYQESGGAIVSASVAGLQIMNPGSSSTATTILLVNLLQYIKYIDINYPSKLYSTFKNQTGSTTSLNFGPFFPGDLKDQVLEYHAPSRFDRFGVNSLFLANFWRGVTTFAILAIAVALVLYIKRIALKNEKLIMVRQQLQSFLTWNYMITFTLSNLDKVSMFAIVEYQSLDLGSGFSVVSFIMNLLFCLGCLGVLAYIPTRVHQIRKQGEIYKVPEDKLKAFDSIKVIFATSKTKYFLQEIVIFIIGLRAVLHNVVISAFDSPIAQSCLLMVISLFMLSYLTVLRPRISIVENVELIIYESILFIVNTTCLYFSTLDSSDQLAAYSAGETVIVCNILALALSILFSVVKVLIPIIKAIREKLAARKKAQNQADTKPEVIELPQPSSEKSSGRQSIVEKQSNPEGVEISGTYEEKDTIQSLDAGESEQGLEAQKTISHLDVNPSSRVIDTIKYPSLGIVEERCNPNKMHPYFGEKAGTIRSMANVNVDSRSSFL